jgi:hypothetical protein
LFQGVKESLLEFRPLLTGSINDNDRKVLLDRLGLAASKYRYVIYHNGFQGTKSSMPLPELKKFMNLSLDFIEHSIRANQRKDKLYHAYNLMSAGNHEVSVSSLSEMLEGQVAVLSSGYLRTEEALEVLDALKSSALFRQDQYSYILYPNKELPGFLKKNTIPDALAKSSELITKLVADGNKEIVEQDVLGEIHFNGNFKHARDLENALISLADEAYKQLVEKDHNLLLDIFENVFNHKAFTGRSGTFFAYEGLGSIYWHMVSKLHVAVQECCIKALEEGADPAVAGRLMDHYYEIGAGIGVHKPPELYGAFPTDPYSHTPQHRGAQQPGMTGQVKEDILVRFGELGVFVQDGKMCFKPYLLRKKEFLPAPAVFNYIDINGSERQLSLEREQLAFTYCSVPVIYSLSESTNKVTVYYADGKREEVPGKILSQELSSQIFKRTGHIEQLEMFFIPPKQK